MKHLKTYNEAINFLSSIANNEDDDVKKIIKDTFVNLEDDYFNIVISKGVKMNVIGKDEDYDTLSKIFTDKLFNSVKKNNTKFFEISTRVAIFKTGKNFILTNDFFDNLNQGVDYLNEIGMSLQFIQAKLKRTYPKSFFRDVDDILSNCEIGDSCASIELFFINENKPTFEAKKSYSEKVIINDEMKQDIHDICLELIDDGYTIHILDTKETEIRITKRNSRGYMDILLINSLVGDIIGRIHHYCNINGYFADVKRFSTFINITFKKTT